MVSEGVRTGRLTAVHVVGVEATTAMDTCHEMLSRVCNCPSGCWDSSSPSIGMELMLNNSLVIEFSEPVLPLHVSYDEVKASFLATPAPDYKADDVQLPLSMFAVPTVSRWVKPWASADAAQANITALQGGNKSRIDLNLQSAPQGGEKLTLNVLGHFFGARGGVLADTVLTEDLWDRAPPLFSARLAMHSYDLRLQAYLNDFPQSTVMINFSEPVFGTGPNGSIVCP